MIMISYTNYKNVKINIVEICFNNKNNENDNDKL